MESDEDDLPRWHEEKWAHRREATVDWPAKPSPALKATQNEKRKVQNQLTKDGVSRTIIGELTHLRLLREKAEAVGDLQTAAVLSSSISGLIKLWRADSPL